MHDETQFEALASALIEQGYGLCDDFLPAADVAALRGVLHRHQAAGEFRPAGIGQGTQHQVATQVRGDTIRWLDGATTDPAERLFLDRVAALSQYLNRRCFLGIRSHEIHYAAYPAGAFYRRHLDVFQAKRGRILSVICYLNENWTPADGGQLRLFLPQEDGTERSLDIEPSGGRLVCFESERLEHEVRPAHRERLSLTGWLRTL